MEFFEWFNIITAFFTDGIPISWLWYLLGGAGAMYVACLILGGFGMKEMAKRQGEKRSFLAFIPFVNTYYAGELAGTASLFGMKIKHSGIYAMVAEILCMGLNVFNFVVTLLLSPYYQRLPQGDVYSYTYSGYPAAYQWMVDSEFTLTIIAAILYIVQIVLFFVVYLALFRKYFTRNAMIMTFVSALLPFRSIAVFAVRKNTPVDYGEYVRKREEEFRRFQQERYGEPSDPFADNKSSAPKQEDPFAEFGGTPSEDDPFDEFK